MFLKSKFVSYSQNQKFVMVHYSYGLFKCFKFKQFKCKRKCRFHVMISQSDAGCGPWEKFLIWEKISLNSSQERFKFVRRLKSIIHDGKLPQVLKNANDLMACIMQFLSLLKIMFTLFLIYLICLNCFDLIFNNYL